MCNLPRLNHEGIENLYRLITSKKIESVIKNPPKNKDSGSDDIPGEFYQTFKDLIPILLKLFQKIKEEVLLSNSFYESSIALIPKPEKHTTKNYRPISLMQKSSTKH